MTDAGSMVMSEKQFAVLTTIQEPTSSVSTLAARLSDFGAKLIVIGDKKGPRAYSLAGTEFLSLEDQLKSQFEMARELPIGHYARKNVGYLAAIRHEASCIYETDDDNAPLRSWSLREETVDAHSVEQNGWVNIFRSFSAATIWPRGFPLDAVRESLRSAPVLSGKPVRARAPIQQGLANNSPDVDAIWRLILDEPFDFESGPSVLLPRGAWCPFNSQSTWWFPVAYPLMYLPSYCSFRMTDIWRSFIAQRCLWELDLGVVFHGSEVIQQRNDHNLIRDFEDEVPGYLRNRELVKILEGLDLTAGAEAVGDNMLVCYEALVRANFFPSRELDLGTSWLRELSNLSRGKHE